jgi:hypothetical protein
MPALGEGGFPITNPESDSINSFRTQPSHNIANAQASAYSLHRLDLPAERLPLDCGFARSELPPSSRKAPCDFPTCRSLYPDVSPALNPHSGLDIHEESLLTTPAIVLLLLLQWHHKDATPLASVPQCSFRLRMLTYGVSAISKKQSACHLSCACVRSGPHAERRWRSQDKAHCPLCGM